jgi:hypothetical protein
MAQGAIYAWSLEQYDRGDVGPAREQTRSNFREIAKMGRGILLWLLGIPLPIVILLVLFMR